MGYDKDSDERYQISKDDEGRFTDDIEVFKMVNLIQRKMMTIFRKI